MKMRWHTAVSVCEINHCVQIICNTRRINRIIQVYTVATRNYIQVRFVNFNAELNEHTGVIFKTNLLKFLIISVENQFFSLSNSGELRKEDTCGIILDDNQKAYAQIQMTECNNENDGKDWILSNVLYQFFILMKIICAINMHIKKMIK